jgi:hypothetical protein
MHPRFEDGAARLLLRTLVAIARIEDHGELSKALYEPNGLRLPSNDHNH